MSAVIQFKSNLRICKSCKTEKHISEFHFHVGNDAYMHRCEECFSSQERKRQKELWASDEVYREKHKAKSRINYKLNPDKRGGRIQDRPDRVKRLYGVTYEHVVQTLANQFGRCANHGCSKEISLEVHGVKANRAVIDHNHKTGKFRAVLCVDCNCLLGQLETKSTKVLGLMDYMNKHN